MTQSTPMHINSVIGTGDPFDAIMLIPLLCDWGVPKDCIFCHVDGAEKSGTLTRILCLAEPVLGHRRVGCCEPHYQERCKPHELPAEAAP